MPSLSSSVRPTLPAAVLAVIAFAAPAVRAQVVIDDILPVSYGVGNQGATGLAMVASYDASASDKLVVVVSTEHAFGINAGMVVNSITYNGQPMTEAVQENTLPGTSAVFFLDNPGPAGELRIFQGNQNGGRATVYALSNVAPGVVATGQSTTNSVDVTTTSGNSLVIAGILDGGQASNGNGAGTPTAAPPMTQDHSSSWGNSWAGHAAGHQFVTSAGVVTSTFNTAGTTRLRAVAVAFRDGCVSCANGAQASIFNLGGGTLGTISTSSNGNLGCDLDWSVTGATPNSVGFFAVGLGTTSIPLGAVVPGCAGTIHSPNPVLIGGLTDPSGASSLLVSVPANQALCGQAVTGQYALLQTGACFLGLTDAITVVIGN